MSTDFLTENQEKIEELKKVISEMKDNDGPLIPIMHHAQDMFGYLPYEIQALIAVEMDIPMTDIYGVATFYTHFIMEPRGETLVGVCMGTPCYVRGSREIVEKLEEELGIDLGETSADRKFTLDITRCMGCCGLAPIIVVNKTVYGNLSPEDIPSIMSEYKA